MTLEDFKLLQKVRLEQKENVLCKLGDISRKYYIDYTITRNTFKELNVLITCTELDSFCLGVILETAQITEMCLVSTDKGFECKYYF